MTETITVPFYFVKNYHYSGGWNIYTLIQANTGKHFGFFWDRQNIRIRGEEVKTNFIKHTDYNLTGVNEKLERYSFTLTIEKTPVLLEEGKMYAGVYYFKLTDESHEELVKIMNMLKKADEDFYRNKTLKAIGLEGEFNDTIR